MTISKSDGMCTIYLMKTPNGNSPFRISIHEAYHKWCSKGVVNICPSYVCCYFISIVSH